MYGFCRDMYPTDPQWSPIYATFQALKDEIWGVPAESPGVPGWNPMLPCEIKHHCEWVNPQFRSHIIYLLNSIYIYIYIIYIYVIYDICIICIFILWNHHVSILVSSKSRTKNTQKVTPSYGAQRWEEGSQRSALAALAGDLHLLLRAMPWRQGSEGAGRQHGGCWRIRKALGDGARWSRADQICIRKNWHNLEKNLRSESQGLGQSKFSFQNLFSMMLEWFSTRILHFANHQQGRTNHDYPGGIYMEV